jgi:hypothetical protein
VVASKRLLVKLGQLRISAFDAERVSKSRDYRMATSAWIVAPWELRPEPAPHKRAG